LATFKSSPKRKITTMTRLVVATLFPFIATMN
jgi:hypothetical protein